MVVKCIDYINDEKIQITGQVMQWSRMPQIFNDVDLMFGLFEIFLQVKQDGEACILKIDPDLII